MFTDREKTSSAAGELAVNIEENEACLAPPDLNRRYSSDCSVDNDYEETRVRALQDMDLLDTPESESFDRITRMASRLFQVPISAVSLTDRKRQWFKSHVGMNRREIPREGAPCAEVTLSRRPLIIPDMLADQKFATCPLANAGIRFYAGVPLTTRDGYVLGAMCVLSPQPRPTTPEEMASLQDFAAMVMTQVELQHDFGRTDSMSGLPNRNQLADDLKDLSISDPDSPRTALLIDLAEPRHFTEMVSVLGTVYIDDLVRASSAAIRETLSRKSGLYQVGITSFVVILDDAKGDVWQDVVNALTARLKTPIISKGIPVPVSVAFGVSPFRLSEVSAFDVLRTAVRAACDAREAELDYAVYSSASDEANRRRFTLLTDIREAPNRPDQFRLVYQPRVDMRTGICVGAEALLRWQNPYLGNVPPGEFIPLVEQTALAGPVTDWVLENALTQVAQWRKGTLDVRVSINISARNLEDPDFAVRVAEALKRHLVPPSCIELEFTESALIRNASRVMSQLAQIRSFGIELAIDDFGTGYSTFSYLQKLPATTVKIDQSFIRGLAESTRDQMLVRSIISIAHDLDYRVVAEGVETAEVYSFLADASCDEVQGYFLSRPLSSSDFEEWVRNSRDSQMIKMLGMLQRKSLSRSILGN